MKLKPKEQKKFNTDAVKSALRKRYAYPAWAFLEEVRDAAGYDATRSADGIAMSLWKSRGLELQGFEIKASRSDWLKERDSPEKAEAISRYCDRWWLVVSDPSIVKDGELPPSWGLLALQGNASRVSLKTIKEAPVNSGVTPLSRTFLATLLKRAVDDRLEMVHPSSLTERIEEEANKLYLSKNGDAERFKEDSDRLKLLLDALGISIWDIRPDALPNIVQAFKMVTGQTNTDAWKRQMEHAAREAGRAHKLATESLKFLESLGKAEE